MVVRVQPPSDTQTLWRVISFERQHVPVGQVYHWQNAVREPKGLVVLQLTRRGSIVYRDQQGEQTVGPGDLLLFTHGESSDYGDPAPRQSSYDCSWMCLQGAGLLAHVMAFRARFGSIHALGLEHPLVAELETLIDQVAPGVLSRPTVVAAALHSFLMRLFEDAEQVRMRQLTPAQQAVEHLLRHPLRVLSLEAVAQRFGCSREHFSRLFVQQVGQTPHAYLTAAKVRRALRLLEATDLPLATVAEQAGFPSTRTMTRHLREVTGGPAGSVRGRRPSLRSGAG